MKTLIDTNVIIDALASREPWKEDAEAIFLLAANRNIDACITTNMVTDIYYLMRKHFSDSKKAKKTMGKLFSMFSLLDVVSVDCIDALQSQMTDYEDSILAYCAKRNAVEFIITRNPKDFVKSPIEALTPRELLKRIE